ncbi:MAG: hypothetical protein ACPG51_01675 [Thiolinea sp.]
MNKTTFGLILGFSFVLLESIQFVYFGGLFQKMNSFQFAFLVFALTILIFVGLAAWKKPVQLQNALAMPRELLAVNVGAVITFTAYLTSVQLLEPAITYTISAGTMPLTAYLLHRLGIHGGEAMRNRFEAAGNTLILFSILFLTIITLTGLSGFVRGSHTAALAGILLAVLDGVFFTLILVYSQRLNAGGVGPATVLGIRLPLYVLVAAAAYYAAPDFPQPTQLNHTQVLIYTMIGFLLLVPPLYFLQQAVSLLSTLTVSTLTALGPFAIFCLQFIEDRIPYSPLTMAGLALYFIGAILAAWGAVKASTQTSHG